jgi:branched-chain amino acid transport system permease protein
VLCALALFALPLLAQQWGRGRCASSRWPCCTCCWRSGLNIVVGYAGLLDLGFVAFYAVGAYMYALLASPHLARELRGLQGVVPGRPAHADLGW